MYCPACGIEMFKVATGESDENLWKEVLLHKRSSVYFYACPKCKRLYLQFFSDGYHFRILGELTSNFVALILASGLNK